MKSLISTLLVSAGIFFFACSPAFAQNKGKAVAPAPRAPGIPVPNQPMMVAIDAPPPPPPPLSCNVTELHFGSQASGVESCLQIMITNTSAAAQTITNISTNDQKRYTIPSPSHQMLPISIQPHSNLTLSVCFKPEKTGEFKTRLVIASLTDSLVIPVDGKGIKPEDVGKLPKTEFSVIKPKKKGGAWSLKYQLVAQSKITLQLFDELGALKMTFLNGAFKNEGAYEQPFDGTDKAKVKFPPGKYYARCLIEEVGRGSQPIKFTKEINIK
jgi:hypothetical protein